MQNQEINKSPEESQTTGCSTTGSSGSSTGDSTQPVEPVEALEIEPKKSIEKGWKYEELKMMLNKKSREKILKYCRFLRSAHVYSKREVEQATAFFEKNFPKRSPYSVYQKALMVARGKFKRVILL